MRKHVDNTSLMVEINNIVSDYISIDNKNENRR